MEPRVVNIFGGRDVGKSTIAMHAAAELRWLGISTALNKGLSHFWGWNPPMVTMYVWDVHPQVLTPHKIAKACVGNINFLVLRKTDYFETLPVEVMPSSDMATKMYTGADEKLEAMMREGHVIYKSLPGVRASVLYVVKKICEEVGYEK